jgi:glycosyltransferase involved in cell wall biosynthesis
MKALSDLAEKEIKSLQVLSAYDQTPDSRYYALSYFKGFRRKKAQFSLAAILAAKEADTILIGHINLYPLGLMLRLLYPRKKLILVTHGIEVWRTLPKVQQRFLNQVDRILAVSNFTKERLVAEHGVAPEKIKVFPNALDPFFPLPDSFTKPTYLLKRFGIPSAAKIVLTVARLSSSEKYKGYDKVIEAMPTILQAIPNTYYMIAGKYDAQEKARLDRLIALHNLQKQVILPGYVPDTELVDHYLLGDVFIMPSKKEGFGIVFLEAMACGLPVIAGNVDGSVDALQDGALGTLLNPDNSQAITVALINALLKEKTREWALNRQENMLSYFSYEQYRQRLASCLKTEKVKVLQE